MNKIRGGHYIFDLKSHIVIIGQKSIEIPLTKVWIKHIEEMAAHEKATSIINRNREGDIKYNDRIAGVEYEDTENKNEDYSE